jgi:hypothetical protein
MQLSTNQKIILGAAVVTAVIVTAVVLYTVWTIHNVGRIKAIGVGIYWNSEATQECKSIDWGTIGAGEVVSVTLYAKNVKNVPFTMTLNTSNWEPTIAGQYLNLGWTYNGAVINPNEVVKFDLTLTVDVNIEGVDNFSFDINIKATEV